MSWTNLAASSPEQAIRWSVKWRQMLGFKQDHAFDDAGSAYGMKPRYVRGIVRDELRVGARWKLLQHRWWADMDRQAAEFRKVADEIEHQKEAEQLAGLQLTLPFGEGAKCSKYCALGSSSGDGGAQ